MSHEYFILAETDYRRERAAGTPRAVRRRTSWVRRLVATDPSDPTATRRR